MYIFFLFMVSFFNFGTPKMSLLSLLSPLIILSPLMIRLAFSTFGLLSLSFLKMNNFHAMELNKPKLQMGFKSIIRTDRAVSESVDSRQMVDVSI